VSLDEYRSRVARGLKYCWRCREWKIRDAFGADTSRYDGRTAKCRRCKNAVGRASYAPVPPEKRRRLGPPRITRRSGDVLQARARINADVRMGLRPNPNDLFCALCGHKGEDRRHEYHHHMGYGAEHHNDVLPVCSRCHRREHV
jgi:hypothetical protein